MDNKIVPQKRVKQQLDLALHSKKKEMRVNRYIQLSAAACTLLLVGFGIFFMQKSNTAQNRLAEMAYQDSIQKEEVAAVLQQLGRSESRSSNIIPGHNAGKLEGFDSTAINTEFEL